MDEYRVDLDAYSGPLDLLLYLVKRHEIDLYDIPIADLTEQYMQHLKLIQEIDVDLAGEFLVMAATLLEIKSVMIIPHAAPEDEPEAATGLSESDPRYELVQQLLAYKRFKDAANALDDQREQWESRFARRPPPEGAKQDADGDDEPAAEGLVEIDLDDASVLDLCEAFSRILDSIGQAQEHQVTYDDTPVSLHAEDIVDRLQRDGAMTLQRIFVGRTTRGELVGLFLATLELVRQRIIRVLQDRLCGEIRLELRPAEEQALPTEKDADWRDPATGEVEYGWPSEEDRLHAERRAEAKRLWWERKKQRDAGEAVPDDEDLEVFEGLDDELEFDEVEADEAGDDDEGEQQQ